MRCETTSSVKECGLRARSTHGVHHAIVEVNIVIGVVLGEVLVAHVVSLVVDAVIGLALSLIAHVIDVVFVVAILHRIFLYGRYTLYCRIHFWLKLQTSAPCVQTFKQKSLRFNRATDLSTMYASTWMCGMKSITQTSMPSVPMFDARS